MTVPVKDGEHLHAALSAAAAGTLVAYAIITLPLLTGGCSDITGVGIGAVDGENLLSNGSFELNHSPTLDGWSIPAGDSSNVGFSHDVPPSGGSYSVSLTNRWTFPGTIQCGVQPLTGTRRYRLTAWGKAVRTGALPAGGEMMLFTVKRDAMLLHKSFHFSDSTWTRAEITDTISSADADGIIVQLRGNIDQWSWGYVHFDLLSLEVIRP